VKKSVTSWIRQVRPLNFRSTKFCQSLPNFKDAVVLSRSRTNFCQAWNLTDLFIYTPSFEGKCQSSVRLLISWSVIWVWFLALMLLLFLHSLLLYVKICTNDHNCSGVQRTDIIPSCFFIFRRYCGLILRLAVSTLKSRSNGLGLSCAQSTALCSWARHFTLIVPVSIQEYTSNNFILRKPDLDSILTSLFHFKETSQIKAYWSYYASAWHCEHDPRIYQNIETIFTPFTFKIIPIVFFIFKWGIGVFWRYLTKAEKSSSEVLLLFHCR